MFVPTFRENVLSPFLVLVRTWKVIDSYSLVDRCYCYLMYSNSVWIFYWLFANILLAITVCVQWLVGLTESFKDGFRKPLTNLAMPTMVVGLTSKLRLYFMSRYSLIIRLEGWILKSSYILHFWLSSKYQSFRRYPFIPMHVTKAWGREWRRRVSPLSLNLGTIWSWMVSFTLWPLKPPGKGFECYVGYRTGLEFWKTKKSPALLVVSS
jgi:hypothetical protein